MSTNFPALLAMLISFVAAGPIVRRYPNYRYQTQFNDIDRTTRGDWLAETRGAIPEGRRNSSVIPSTVNVQR
jgi:hypothetical protein